MKLSNAVQYYQQYVNGIEYRQNPIGNAEIEAIYHSEGRVAYTAGANPKYEYSIKDHLGNTRLTFCDLNGDGAVQTPSEILQENHYFPFGLSLHGPWMNATAPDNLYQYSGKELQSDHGLGWLDFGARMYMPEAGRFTTLDRFSEKYYSLAPYQYAANNPTLFMDINGDSIRIVHRGENIIYHNGNLTWAGTRNAYDGKALKNGKVKGFVGKTVEALDKIRTGGSTGNQLIEDIQNDTRFVNISSGTRNNATGLDVEWNPSIQSSGLNEAGNTRRPSFIGLAHELAHTLDKLEDGKIDRGLWFSIQGKTIPNAEKYASHWENRIRAENGLALRTHYTDTEYNDARLVQGNTSVHFTEQMRVQINPTLGGVKKLYYPNHHINIEMTVAFKYKK